MPQAGALIAMAALSAGTGALLGVTVLGLSVAATAAVLFGAQVALGLIAQALGRVKPAALSHGPRTLTVRDAAAPRRIVLGETRLGGVIVYMTTTDNDTDLHLVVALCDGPVTALDATWFDDAAVLDHEIDSAGWVTQGRFAGVLRIAKHLGDAPQTADAYLTAAVEEWTADHRLDGIAYLYLTLRRDDAAYPAGIPNISVDVRGAAVKDPRDAGTRFTRNAALLQHWWMQSPGWGLGAPDAEIDAAGAVAAANLAEEAVPVAALDGAGAAIEDVFSAKLAANWFERTTTTAPLGHADDGAVTGRGAGLVSLTTTGVLPAPLSGGVYYAIADSARREVFRLAASASDARDAIAIPITDTGSGIHTLQVTITRRIKDEADEVTVYTDDFTATAVPGRMVRVASPAIGWRRGDTVQVASTGTAPPPLAAVTDYYVMPDAGGGFRLATSYANAIADTAIALTGPGSGVHTVTRTAEARYAGGGVIEAGISRKASLEALLSASFGRAVWTGGAWRLGGAAARTATLTLDEDDLRGPIRLRTRLPRRDRFNAVEGQYASPDAGGQAVSYPRVASAAFQALDAGELIARQIDFPFNDSAATCQRLATIALLRARQEITAEITASLKALPLVAGDWVALSVARFGWVAKEFDVETWGLAVESGGAGPALVVRLGLRETAAASYDWASSLETTVDPAPNTTLPSPWDIPTPAGLRLVETLYETRDGAGVKARARLSWQAVDNGFVAAGGRYLAEYRATGSTLWIALPRVPDSFIDIDDIAPDIYEFHVQAVGRLGQTGAWSAILEQETRGLLAPPADMTGLIFASLSSLAILTWTRHPDLDVRIGGRIRIRHSSLQTGATWPAASEIADPLPGDATQVILPVIAGTYLLRPYDSSGIAALAPTTITTDGAILQPFTSVGTIQEAPAFAGAHVNTAAPDGVLKLDGLGLFDDIPDFDAIVLLDSFGGLQSSGSYTFATGFDLGSVQAVRLRAGLTGTSDNTLDQIDSRTAPIDSWASFDGEDAADADVTIMVRKTDDDPAAAPVWGPWSPLIMGEYSARGFQFRADLASSDPAYNVLVSQLGVDAEQLA